MTTRESGPSLRVPLKTSRQQLLVLLVGHIVPLLLLPLSAIRWPWVLAGCVLVLAHGVWTYHQFGWVRRLRQLEYRSQSYWLVLQDGGRAATQVRPYFLRPWLTIIEIRSRGRWRRLPLFADSSDADSLRRLRVLLRCGHGLD